MNMYLIGSQKDCINLIIHLVGRGRGKDKFLVFVHVKQPSRASRRGARRLYAIPSNRIHVRLFSSFK